MDSVSVDAVHYICGEMLEWCAREGKQLRRLYADLKVNPDKVLDGKVFLLNRLEREETVFGFLLLRVAETLRSYDEVQFEMSDEELVAVKGWIMRSHVIIQCLELFLGLVGDERNRIVEEIVRLCGLWSGQDFLIQDWSDGFDLDPVPIG